jgi:outer membrane protein assembly factor BamB
MHPLSRIPRLCIVAVALAALTFGCQTVERSTVEASVTAQLLELVPDGRVFPNDLATDREVGVADAWLFDRELIIQDSYGRLTSLDRGDLGARWYFAGVPGLTDFAPTAGPVSIGFVHKGVFYEVKRDFGVLMHTMRLSFVPSAPLALSDSTAWGACLATSGGNQTLLSINLATGLTGWGMSTRGSVVSAPVFNIAESRNMLYFATETGRVYGFPAEGAASAAPEPAWSTAVHGRVTSSPVVSRDPAGGSSDLLFVTTENGEVWALDLVTGQTRWVAYSGRMISGAAWPAGDQVYFQNTDGFQAVSRADGQKAWSLPVTGTFIARRGDTMFLRTTDGVVHAVATASGEILRSVGFSRSVRFLPNLKDGVLYAFTDKGLVMALGMKPF